MEEGIFPSYKSIGENQELEEERRLCYVGITRAREYLYLTSSKQRTIFGSTTCNSISRFIEEIPKDLIKGNIESSENKNNYEDSNYEWSYGTRGKTKNKEYNDNYSINNKKGFTFRTAESFLNSLNKSRDKDNIDLGKYKEGQSVSHKKFGIGVIKKIEEEGEDLKVDIEFEKAGNKRLMAKYADLEII